MKEFCDGGEHLGAVAFAQFSQDSQAPIGFHSSQVNHFSGRFVLPPLPESLAMLAVAKIVSSLLHIALFAQQNSFSIALEYIHGIHTEMAATRLANLTADYAF